MSFESDEKKLKKGMEVVELIEQDDFKPGGGTD